MRNIYGLQLKPNLLANRQWFEFNCNHSSTRPISRLIKERKNFEKKILVSDAPSSGYSDE
jgi:hypothetical protein